VNGLNLKPEVNVEVDRRSTGLVCSVKKALLIHQRFGYIVEKKMTNVSRSSVFTGSNHLTGKVGATNKVGAAMQGKVVREPNRPRKKIRKGGDTSMEKGLL